MPLCASANSSLPHIPLNGWLLPLKFSVPCVAWRVCPITATVFLGTLNVISYALLLFLNTISLPFLLYAIPVASVPLTALSTASASVISAMSFTLFPYDSTPYNPHIFYSSNPLIFKYSFSSALSPDIVFANSFHVIVWNSSSVRFIAISQSKSTNCNVAINVLYLNVPLNILSSTVNVFVRLTAVYRPSPDVFAPLRLSLGLSILQPYLDAHLSAWVSVRRENLNILSQNFSKKYTILAIVFSCSSTLSPSAALFIWTCNPHVPLLWL